MSIKIMIITIDLSDEYLENIDSNASLSLVVLLEITIQYETNPEKSCWFHETFYFLI